MVTIAPLVPSSVTIVPLEDEKENELVGGSLSVRVILWMAGDMLYSYWGRFPERVTVITLLPSSATESSTIKTGRTAADRVA